MSATDTPPLLAELDPEELAALTVAYRWFLRHHQADGPRTAEEMAVVRDAWRRAWMSCRLYHAKGTAEVAG